MNRPEEMSKDETPARWLLLVHQLPAKPAYPRVKIWRRLQALGAVTVKSSVYLLPADEQTQEDFEWVLKEVIEAGGEGMICETRLVDGLSDHEARALFNAARDADYAAIATSARALVQALPENTDTATRADAATKLARLKAEAARIVEIDFFGADGRETVQGLLSALEAQLQESEAVEDAQSKQAAQLPELKGRTWVTRQGVHVDRIASAWLIRRFIDPDARFKFVPAKGYAAGTGRAAL